MHYKKADWQNYVLGLIPDKERKLMENHLYECDSCLETFLSLVTEENVKSAGKALSPSFTDNVLALLPQARVHEPVSNGNKRATTLYYYLAAACITAIFLWVGVFDSLAGYIPGKSTQTIETTLEMQLTQRFGWSENL